MNFNKLLLSIFSGLQILFVSAQMTPTYNDILIPMRDGQFLSADVFIPSNITQGEVILIQTPYNKNAFSWSLPLGIGQNLDSQPFIWVIVDWRGFYGSSGAATSNPNRGEDGFDVCEWIVQQSWHLDRIGTWGPSALGGIQYDLAFEHHPNHTCAVPMVAHPQFAYDDYFYGGILEEARLEQLDALGYGLSPIIMANVYYSNTWAFAENSTWTPGQLSIPTLQIGGWYDHNIDKMTDWYKATRSSSTLPNEQWFLVGPWVHGGTGAAYVGSSIQGELTYPDAAFKSDSMAWDFFNYYLLDSVNNWQNTPGITYYQTGNSVWGTTSNPSIEILNTETIFLNTNYSLSSTVGVSTSSFISDPSNPAPTIGGANLHPNLEQGPYDQITLESRNDIITFETVDLPSDVTISGRVLCDLYFESDQPDCDIMVHLVDVYPDGRNMLITDGARRMRFRNGYTVASEEFMTPGTVYNVDIELPFTHYTWKAGHKIKIYIGGNSAIRWNVNLQNGGPMYTAGTSNIAGITIHHNSTYPSSITLPGNNQFLSLNEEFINDITIYPVPSDDLIRISGTSEIDGYSIHDLSGRLLLTGNDVNIDISGLEGGVYTMVIRSGKELYERKFVKL